MTAQCKQPRLVKPLLNSNLNFKFKSSYSFTGGLEKCLLLSLQEYWSKVLINTTIYASFTFLVTILLYHNQDSYMLMCLGSLNELTKFSPESIVCRNMIGIYAFSWGAMGVKTMFGGGSIASACRGE